MNHAENLRRAEFSSLQEPVEHDEPDGDQLYDAWKDRNVPDTLEDVENERKA